MARFQRRLQIFILATGLAIMTGLMGQAAAPPTPEGATVILRRFEDLAGWDKDDHAAAFRVFRAGCVAMTGREPALRAGKPAPESLIALCRKAATLPESLSGMLARRFFEDHFQPYQIQANDGRGLLTGYYEPEVRGSLEKTAEFDAPVLGRPEDLVTFLPEDPRPAGIDPTLAGAQRTEDGLRPYMDRAAIYAGGLKGRGLEQLFLRDEPEVFIIQVQGSARIRLPDGRLTRLVYAGRNGLPYTSIGKVLISEGHIPAAEMSLERLMGWLRANPADARRIMTLNRSYVFFRRVDDMDPQSGPTGGAGLPLTSGRSIAVDRTIWPYGLPVFINAVIDTLREDEGHLSRLTIAQDTGSAILGPARADYFWGTGDEAGRKAGLTRHAFGFTVLWPKEAP